MADDEPVEIDLNQNMSNEDLQNLRQEIVEADEQAKSDREDDDKN